MAHSITLTSKSRLLLEVVAVNSGIRTSQLVRLTGMSLQEIQEILQELTKWQLLYSRTEQINRRRLRRWYAQDKIAS